MSSITRRQATAFIGTGVAAAFGLPRGAQAAGRTVTIASLLGNDKPETLVWHRIRDIVENKLPGRFQFRIVPNGALGGGEKEVAEGIRLGSIQGSVSTTSVFAGWVPQAQILDLPFLFRDREHLQRVLDGQVGQDLKSAIAEQGFVALGYINYGARHLLAKEAILTPEGLAGKRVRAVPNPVHTELWKALKAQPIALPIAETYNALKTGVADAMDLTKSAYAGLKLYEVVPFLIETAHIWASGTVYLSAKFWNSLNDEEKQAFSEAAAEGATYFNELIIKDEDVSVAQSKSAGGQILAVTDRTAWENAAQQVWTLFAPKLGGIEFVNAVHAS
ncbi:tripartite ATP-independent transporter DctP family solute receptor [Pseudochelatococcus lubricantis]|uniref:Tripartite ATP-independent transporter DctP family solute receptor n=1 Tax=Pseudochelatococcus lubricantis TaxID=1538102 RepID=A0ABX0UW48_9HYPH|nr:TRAP transporter substrate-binding protein [Pseudochelatococcus lubricantis]NIJ56623.1 tripartite ATP-independent transporter DctP family solute receptor [Pseudochelatococcus lubricantis]